MRARAAVTWRYLSRRTVKHALEINGGVAGHAAVALCGTAPGWFVPSSSDWLGTGSQTEYDTVDGLPECRRCARMVAPATLAERNTP
jgi:hypothetical protein